MIPVIKMRANISHLEFLERPFQIISFQPAARLTGKQFHATPAGGRCCMKLFSREPRRRRGFSLIERMIGRFVTGPLSTKMVEGGRHNDATTRSGSNSLRCNQDGN